MQGIIPTVDVTNALIPLLAQNLLAQNLLAQGEAGGGGAGGEEAQGFAPMIFMFVILYLVFYLLLIRPQRKQQMQHEKLLKDLKKNDQVRTSGGLFGKVARVEDGQDQVVLIVDEKQNVRVKVLRSSIVAVIDRDGVAQEPVAATGKPR